MVYERYLAKQETICDVCAFPDLVHIKVMVLGYLFESGAHIVAVHNEGLIGLRCGVIKDLLHYSLNVGWLNDSGKEFRL